MAKQPFIQETLYKLYEDNGVITLDLIAEALPTWTLADIKQRLSGWRYRKAIDYKLEDDELIDFEFLRNKKAQQVEITEGHRLKLSKKALPKRATATKQWNCNKKQCGQSLTLFLKNYQRFTSKKGGAVWN